MKRICFDYFHVQTGGTSVALTSHNQQSERAYNENSNSMCFNEANEESDASYLNSKFRTSERTSLCGFCRDGLVKDTSTMTLWPEMASLETKYKCLDSFNKTMSNEYVEQSICAVCATLQYKRECISINVGCIPNQHLLHLNDHLPPCVIRMDIPVDSKTKHVHLPGKNW